MEDKSLHQLRGIAQSFGIKDIFSKTESQLKQEIELKQVALVAPPAPDVPKPPYDARLMTKPPAKKSDQALLEEYLEPYIKRGLHVRFDEERWYFQYDKKTDEGTLRMPPRVVLQCADKILR